MVFCRKLSSAAKNQVSTSLGKPDCDTDLGDTGSILLYAWYEFFFNHENNVYSIQNDNCDPKDKESFCFKNDVFEIEPWLLNGEKNQTIESVKALLQKNLLEYKIIEYYGRNAIKLESGIVVDFDEEKNENDEFELLGIRFWPE